MDKKPQGKKQCGKGYNCGGACISRSKICRKKVSSETAKNIIKKFHRVNSGVVAEKKVMERLDGIKGMQKFEARPGISGVQYIKSLGAEDKAFAKDLKDSGLVDKATKKPANMDLMVTEKKEGGLELLIRDPNKPKNALGTKSSDFFRTRDIPTINKILDKYEAALK